MQAVRRWSFDCQSHLRTKCLVIGYWHLIASLFNILCHVNIIFVLTNGFQCEISKETLRAVQWGWLEPVLLIINFGAHGFYAFPLIFNYYHKDSIKYLPLIEKDPPCYPGMCHIDSNDVIYFLINVFWLKIVLNFITAVHKKSPGPMATFYGWTILKTIIQIVNFTTQSSYNNPFLDILYKIVDVCLIILFMKTINKYVEKLKKNKSLLERLPAHVEKLYDELKPRAEEKKNTVLFVLDEKTVIPPIEDKKEKF